MGKGGKGSRETGRSQTLNGTVCHSGGWLLVGRLGSHQRSIRRHTVWPALHLEKTPVRAAGGHVYLSGPDWGQEGHWGTGTAIHLEGEEVTINSCLELFFDNSLCLINLYLTVGSIS